MTCPHSPETHLLLSGESEDTDTARAHLAECAECQAEFHHGLQIALLADGARMSVNRFRIVDNSMAIDARYPGAEDLDANHWSIYEFDGERPIRCVGSDGGEPEDQTLIRNLSWVVDAMNAVHFESVAEIATLASELRKADDRHSVDGSMLAAARQVHERQAAEIATLKARVARFEQSTVELIEGQPGTCTYCRSVGACPRCWGRAAIDALTARVERYADRLVELEMQTRNQADMMNETAAEMRTVAMQRDAVMRGEPINLGAGPVNPVGDLLARVEEAERKQAIDQRQCDDMTSEAGRLAGALREAEREREQLRAGYNKVVDSLQARAQRAEALLAETVADIERVVPYVTATVGHGGRLIHQKLPLDWISIHRGRADSSINQLNNLESAAKKRLLPDDVTVSE